MVVTWWIVAFLRSGGVLVRYDTTIISLFVFCIVFIVYMYVIDLVLWPTCGTIKRCDMTWLFITFINNTYYTIKACDVKEILVINILIESHIITSLEEKLF